MSSNVSSSFLLWEKSTISYKKQTFFLHLVYKLHLTCNEAFLRLCCQLRLYLLLITIFYAKCLQKTIIETAICKQKWDFMYQYNDSQNRRKMAKYTTDSKKQMKN